MKNKTAIFICGSGGSGKSTFARENFQNHTLIDVDIIYEQLLKESGLGLKIKDFNENETLESIRLFENAKILNDLKFDKAIEDGDNIVIDSIGRDSSVVFYQRNILEKLGYVTLMVMIYADLETCLDRVERRERVYKEKLTIDSWYESYSNLTIYKKEFKTNFLFVFNEEDKSKEKISIFMDNNLKQKKVII